MLELNLEGDIEIAAELDFTYGFDLTVCCVGHLSNVLHINKFYIGPRPFFHRRKYRKYYTVLLQRLVSTPKQLHS